MRSERARKLLLVFEHFWGFIEILFAAVIALDTEVAFEERAGCDGVGLGKGDPMPEEKVLPKMKPMILAEHHPTVVAIDPHFLPFTFSRLVPVATAGGTATAIPVPPRASGQKEDRLCCRKPSSLLPMFSDAEGRPCGPS
jgi:hypothetical protein